MSIPKYHQSSITTYLKCGKMYEYRYVMGIKSPPKAALTVGKAVDIGVTENFKQKIATGFDLSLDETLDVYSTNFDRLDPETEWVGDERFFQKDVGYDLITAHHTVFAPLIDPETTQEEFDLETDAGYSLGGTFDLTTKDKILVDTKTSKLKYDEASIQTNIQPLLYDFAYEALRGEKAKSFRYDVLIKPTKTNPVRTQQVESVISPEAREFLFETIDQVHRGITAGIALPAPEGAWYCSVSWCFYGQTGVCPKFRGKLPKS